MSKFLARQSTQSISAIPCNNDSCQMPSYSAAWQTLGPDVLWPRSCIGGALCAPAMSLLSARAGASWDWTLLSISPGAGQRRDQIAGVTRDINGVAVGSVTVRLFDSVNDQLIDKVTSDANGNFAVSSAWLLPYAGQQVYASAPGASVSGTTTIQTPT